MTRGHRGPVWALWYGGPSYSAPYVADAERFDSLAHCREIMDARYANRGRYWPGELETPAVEDDSMAVFYADPRDSADPYPDLMLSRGPRGGIRQERC